MIHLLTMTDGRDGALAQTVESIPNTILRHVSKWTIHDDTADRAHARSLDERYHCDTVISPPHRLGFGGAIRNAWQYLNATDDDGCDFVFHLEDDFVFTADVDALELVGILDAHPHVVQVALKRQPWNHQERDAGGIIEQRPDDYENHADPFPHCTHRRFFTTNPSLYRRSLCRRSWPDVEASEGMFTVDLLGDPDLQFAFYGYRFALPKVEHIGHDRVGTGY